MCNKNKDDFFFAFATFDFEGTEENFDGVAFFLESTKEEVNQLVIVAKDKGEPF